MNPDYDTVMKCTADLLRAVGHDPREAMSVTVEAGRPLKVTVVNRPRPRGSQLVITNVIEVESVDS